jgi:predicted Zn-dependent protease
MEDILEWLVEKAKDKGCSFAEARFVRRAFSHIRAQDGRIEELSQRELAGVGIRVILDGAWGFASTASLTKKDLSASLEEAIASANVLRNKVEDKAEVEEMKSSQLRRSYIARFLPRMFLPRIRLNRYRNGKGKRKTLTPNAFKIQSHL